MKIVKFKDGTHAIRKWDWHELGYVFYFVRDHSKDFSSPNWGGFWNIMEPSYETGIKHETYISALELYKALTRINDYKKSLKDTGTTVKAEIDNEKMV